MAGNNDVHTKFVGLFLQIPYAQVQIVNARMHYVTVRRGLLILNRLNQNEFYACDVEIVRQHEALFYSATPRLSY